MKKHLLHYLLTICAVLLVTAGYSQNWQIVGSGLPFHFANANNEVIEFNGDMYSVGYVFDGIDTYTPKVFKLSGGIWSEVGSGFTTTASAGAYNINAIAEYNSELFIGGNFIMDNGTDAAFNDVAKWDNSNSRWVPVGDGTGDGTVNELTVFNSKLYAGGDFDDLGTAGTNNIAVWAGTSWAAVGAGTSTATDATFGNDQVTSMVQYSSDLYIGGKFTTAGGELTHNIAIWTTGDVWDYSNFVGNNVEGYGGVGAISDGYILSMAVFGSDLFIGGTFTKYYNSTFISSSTSIANHLVVWSGSSFTAPTKATPTNQRINAMTVFDGRIYIGNVNESNIYSWDGSIFDWDLAPDRDPIRQRVTNFYSNATDIYYAQNYGVYKLSDPAPSFSASSTTACADSEITFTDTSTGTNTITTWNWTFEGGTPATSDLPNPVVTFAAGGPYDVTLEVTSSDGTNSSTSTDYITIEDAVSVSVDPTPSTICSNENATFSVSGASGTGGVTYQWQINEGAGYVDVVDDSGIISGVTSTTVTFVTPSVDLDGATLQCVVTNGCGTTATSAEALLNIIEAPELITQVAPQAVCVSGDASFTVEASVESGTLTYQWQYLVSGITYLDLADAGVYSGTNTATLIITGADNTLAELVSGTTTAVYRCVITANGCNTNTGLVYLNIHDAPIVSTQPIDITECDTGTGITTSFNVVSSIVVGGLTYQWQLDAGSGFDNVDDIDIYSGASTNTLLLSGATTTANGSYRCIIGNCASDVISDIATLTIDTKPVLVSSPLTQTICAGSDVTFTAEATGDNLVYQWQEAPVGTSSYVDIVNNSTYFATDGTLDISAATTSLDNKIYRCVISSGSCDVANNKALNTSSALLSVESQPTISPSTTTANLTVCEDGSTTLAATASGSSTPFNNGTFSYQWQADFAGTGVFTDLSDDANYSNTGTRLLTITDAPLSFDGNEYRCVIRGCTVDIPSTPETLIVLQLPLVITSPESQSVCGNESVTFTASATGSDITYTWWRDTGDGSYAQQTSSNSSPDYTFTADASFNGYKYKCIATAGSCTTTAESSEATLTVNQIVLNSGIPNVTICNDENTTFTIDVLGDGLTYQWQINGTDLADGGIYTGVNTATLTITGANNISIGQSNNFGCTVSNSCGEVGTTANLQVQGTEKPVITADFNNADSPTLSVNNVFGDSYEWFLDGTSLGTSGSSFTIDQVGSYTVIVTINGCPSEESDPQVVIVTGIGQNPLNQVSIFPNPVKDQLIVAVTDIQKGTQIHVLSLDGRVKKSIATVGRNNTIDMSDLSTGVYLVQIKNSTNTATYKVIKE